MPNIKSQIKRVETNEAARKANAADKAEFRTAIKKVEAFVKEGKKEEAAAALKVAVSLLDKAVQSGVIAKNNADRKKAHLQKAIASVK